MASTPEMLPEGTDAIIEDSAVLGADEGEDEGEGEREEMFAEEPEEEGAGDPAEPAPADTLKEKAGSFKEQATAHAADLRGKANEQVFAFAAQGKDRVTDSLDGVAKYVGDIAAQVEEKLGPQYAGYARQAADAVSGISASLRDKDVEELFEDARGYVRKSPAVAIGAAAAAGFLISRLVKAGSETLEAAAKDIEGKSGGKSGGAG